MPLIGNMPQTAEQANPHLNKTYLRGANHDKENTQQSKNRSPQRHAVVGDGNN